jgi:CHAT domain-containing protein
LALAGCNDRKNSGDDGFLTGVEVLNSDLSQSKLVVLSACNTASGDIRDSEGAIGLRSAFLLAGSRGVIATCWEASDAESVSLTNSFLKFLRGGESATLAIGSAQRERIKTLRNRFGAAHPFFWGAFTFTGNDSVLSDIRL